VTVDRVAALRNNYAPRRDAELPPGRREEPDMSEPLTASRPSEPGGAAIEVLDLYKSFGDLEVLKGIDFTVAHGEVVCVVGPSGSGKSTLLRCVNRLEEATSGTILIEGEDITDIDADVDQLRKKKRHA
jgi:polar amino acid transport system ATP-binding protein